MKTYHIGDRIPDPYYGWVTRRGVSRCVFRKCKSTTCRFEWTNFEVPIYKQWDTKRRSDRCPVDIQHKTRVVYSLTPRTMYEKTDLTTGPQLSLTLGAAYRRRECLQEGCETDQPLGRGRKTKQNRWSTMELDPSGVVRQDVTTCSRCGDMSKVLQVRDLDGL